MLVKSSQCLRRGGQKWLDCLGHRRCYPDGLADAAEWCPLSSFQNGRLVKNFLFLGTRVVSEAVGVVS